MKTSFYFVLWILIYPVLGLIHNSFIDNYSFIVALGIVWGISWILKQAMPETLNYEWGLENEAILEDVYTGNVASFGKRLLRDTIIETVTSIYFLVTTFVIGMACLRYGSADVIALAVFAVFTYGSITRAIRFNKARLSLRRNPTQEQCREIADDTYQFPYELYYNQRCLCTSWQEMLPPRPRHFKAFQIFSLVMACLAIVLGLLNLIGAIGLFLSDSSVMAGSVASMYFLYGGLATCFGVKDCVSITRALKRRSVPREMKS